MKPIDLILRCYGERKGDVWQAFCIDLNLAAQGKTAEEVKRKLEQQIQSYLYDALAGADKEYALQLLSRKAPLSFRVKYHYYKLLCKIGGTKEDICRIFNSPMPMVPLHNHA